MKRSDLGRILRSPRVRPLATSGDQSRVALVRTIGGNVRTRYAPDH